jgi:hypothetical protein
LVVFSQQGGWPSLPSHGNSGPLPTGEIKAIRVSPGYADDHTLFFVLDEPLGDGFSGGRVYRSTDDGQTWVKLSGGLPLKYDPTLDLEISPGFSRDRTLFIGGHWGTGWGNGVYRSTDGGDTWQAMWNGLTHLRVYDVVLSPNYAADGTLLAYADYYDALTPFYAGSGGSILRSTDKGLNWTLVITKPGPAPAWMLALPTPDTLLPPSLSLPDIRFRAVKGGTGLERTTDAGQTWAPITVTLRPNLWIQQILSSPDPIADPTLYVLSQYDLYRSTDHGSTWERWRDARLAGRHYGTHLTTGAISPRLPDGSYRLFIGTAKGEFWTLDPRVLTWEPERLVPQWPTSFEGEQIHQIKVAPDGGLWLRTQNTLLHYMAGAVQARYTTAEGLPIQDNLSSISVAPDGTLWVSGSRSVANFDGHTWKYHDLSSLVGNGSIMDVAAGRGGNVWAGGDFGILHWDGRAWKLVSDPGERIGSPIYDIEIDRSGAVWFATSKGLMRYSDRMKLGNDLVRLKVAFGANSVIYSLGDRNVWRYASGKWAALPEPQDKHFDFWRSEDAFYIAADGAIWAGSDEGAFRYDGRVWRQFSVQDGLPSNKIYAIVEDAEGWLWFGTDQGAARVNPRTLNLSTVVWK